MGTSAVETRKVVINGTATATLSGIDGVVYMLYTEYASGGNGTISCPITDSEGATIATGAGIAASASATQDRDTIGGTIAIGDLTCTPTATPDDDYTVVLYIVP